MRYAVLGPGKRLRPFLVLTGARLFNVAEEGALRVAAAVEMLHCYSLVHDDLPAMDDSELRRGRPTLHRKFDEATAILAGDALLTLAFEVVARRLPVDLAGPVAAELARASGTFGMIGGQALDLAAEGKRPRLAMVEEIHRLKTAALIVGAVR